MLFRNIVPSPKGDLLPDQVLELIGIFLEGAKKANNDDVVLVLCHHAEAALAQAKSSTKKGSTLTDPDEQDLRERVAEAYFDLGKLMDDRQYRDEAKALYKKAHKLDARVDGSGRRERFYTTGSIVMSIKDTKDDKEAPHRNTDSTAPYQSSQRQLKKPNASVAIPGHIFPKD
ncbi:hypothetical protein BGX31_006004, partial [Mortierella sp. GBA43]